MKETELIAIKKKIEEILPGKHFVMLVADHFHPGRHMDMVFVVGSIDELNQSIESASIRLRDLKTQRFLRESVVRKNN